MSAENVSPHVDDAELLFRRIPVSMQWYDPAVSPFPSFLAFRPSRDRDPTGISVDRACSTLHPEFRTIEKAAEGKSASGYYVAVLRAGDLRAAGIDVIARPVEGNPGHAELPSLTSVNRDTPEAEETMKKLAER